MSNKPYLFTETSKDLVTTVKLKSMNGKIKDSAVCEMVSGYMYYAQLFSTSPELLAALEWALENLDNDLDPDFQAAKTQCEMVVKKAKGGSMT